jgi:hypothetical protein
MRIGFGGVTFQSQSEIGCIADVDDLRGHDAAIAGVSKAHQFASAITVSTQVQLRSNAAFIQAQRGRCAYI